jgi:hypothetical protein
VTAEQALYSRLSTSNVVTDLVGTRIYPMESKQADIAPYITYERVGAGTLHTMRGALDEGLPRLQVNCWADTYASAKSVARAVRTALNGYDIGSVAMRFLDDRDLMNPDSLRKGVAQDYSIWTEEA